MRRALVLMLAVTLADTPLIAQRFTPRLVPSPASERAGWEIVLNLPEGTLLEVQNRVGTIVAGAFRSANAEALVITQQGAPIEVLRPSIARVVRLGAKKTVKSAQRGFLIGAAAGVTQGALTVETNRGKWMLILAALEGAIGAAIGALHGAATRERMPIYVAAGP
jgi:hypothetical protein